MIVKMLQVGPIMTNCYIVGCEKTKQGAIIDPGGNGDYILSEVRMPGLDIKYVINTHCHFDHTLANREVIEGLKGRQQQPPLLAIHRAEEPMLKSGGGAALFGLRGFSSPPPDVYLEEGDVLTLGRVKLKVLHTPGHSVGSISLLNEEEKAVFDGDVLFNMGIGRTDLTGGSFETLMDSIRNKLLTLPDDTVVYSGHGPVTTIGRERAGNPFLTGRWF
ncbi:MAG TPA: MBL fold metallo-hydrolase [Anaerolineae bacterium]|nr:MBL fold metallo-hydrolase [Anaerolineae bacterium]